VIKICPECGASNRINEKGEKDRFYCGSCRKPLFRRQRLSCFLAFLTLLWVVFPASILLLRALGPEFFWFGSLNLYAPQWIYALPGVIIVPAYLFFARRYLWFPVAILALIFGPLMGLVVSFPKDNPSKPHLRVMTYNIKWAERGSDKIVAEIVRENPDLIQFQDAGDALRHDDIKQVLSKYHVRSAGQYIVASKFPIVSFDPLNFPVTKNYFRPVRTVIDFGGRQIAIYDAHLLSPREGLVAVKREDLTLSLENASIRMSQATTLMSAISQEKLPHILTGDMNAPLGSVVCDTLMQDSYRDSFAESGRGYGYTYGRFTKVKTPYVRIDHIFFSPDWRAAKCWTGGIEGSDHVPVYADLWLNR